MNKLTFFLLITFAILFEATITSIPIVLDVLLVFYILKRKSGIFITAFILGIILDVFMVRTLGLTSIFFIAFIFVVFLYERKFEIVTYPFVFFASFLGSLISLLLFGYNYLIQQAIVSSLFAVVLFRVVIPNLFRNLV
ncbi:MAG: hypothetical protein AAB600_05270 [Patescibacteria group bacterium]